MRLEWGNDHSRRLGWPVLAQIGNQIQTTIEVNGWQYQVTRRWVLDTFSDASYTPHAELEWLKSRFEYQHQEDRGARYNNWAYFTVNSSAIFDSEGHITANVDDGSRAGYQPIGDGLAQQIHTGADESYLNRPFALAF